jgi:2'-5' RNA ligase
MRAFVAIDIPDPLRACIAALLSELRNHAPNVRWSRPEALHITLKFLGEVPQPKVGEVENCLSAVDMEKPQPLEISVRGSGFFPSERVPRVVWLGIEAGPALGKLASRVEQSLLPMGFAKEDRPFSPHLTLGRIREFGQLGALREQLQRRAPLEIGSFVAQEFFLYESKPAPGGSVYRQIARFPFAD